MNSAIFLAKMAIYDYSFLEYSNFQIAAASVYWSILTISKQCKDHGISFIGWLRNFFQDEKTFKQI